jgi:UDP-N-acetylmuramate--alanine ligase
VSGPGARDVGGAAFPDPHATAADPGVTVDLGAVRRVHLIGLGGSAMQAIASVLTAMGKAVSGSDLRDSTGLERLRAAGIGVVVGHDAANLPDDVDLVGVSTAIPGRNPELREARRRGVPVASRAALTAAIAAERATVAVAGTHGKTTTSSMLALVLSEAGLRPSFIIGGDINAMGTGAVWDDGEWFVVEADESDGTFLELPRRAAVVTNVEPDHLDHWGDFDGLKAAFTAFLAATPGPAVVCADDPVAAELAAAVAAGGAAGVVTYGTAPDARFRMVDVVRSRQGTTFELFDGDERLGAVQLPILGLHNARNACAAIVTALQLGAPFAAGRSAMARFAGVARRFQHRGEVAGVTFIEDYAHLPTEVSEAALGAARDGARAGGRGQGARAAGSGQGARAAGSGQDGWDRIVCVFQPHRYSRTASLWRSFADAFVGADVLVVTDVYASGEAPRPGVSGKLIVDAVLAAHARQRVVYLPHRADVVSFLERELRPGDLCLTLGAGDITTLPDEVMGRLSARAAGGLPVGRGGGVQAAGSDGTTG